MLAAVPEECEQVVFIEAQVDLLVPEHSHKAQWELVVAGEVDLTIGGDTTTYRRGDCFHIPEGVAHSALVHAGYRAVVFFDQVDRYRAKGIE